jgi:hypothetical protein
VKRNEELNQIGTMRNFFHGLWRVITFPFRLVFGILAFPFRAIYRFNKFLNTEPEEHPIADVFSDLVSNTDTRQMLWEQVEALRFHILRAVIVLSISVIAAFWVAQDVMEFLAIPY